MPKDKTITFRHYRSADFNTGTVTLEEAKKFLVEGALRSGYLPAGKFQVEDIGGNVTRVTVMVGWAGKKSARALYEKNGHQEFPTEIKLLHA